MLLALGFLLLVSLVINAGITAVSTYFNERLPTNWAVVLHAINLILTFGVTFLLFALIFKFLPEINIRWSDVLIGAAITAALFMVGKYVIGLYLGTSAVGSSYGAAGSFVVLLLWLYYSTLILLFGAELTQVYAERCGNGASPGAHAVAVPRSTAGPSPALDERARGGSMQPSA
jgi:membrane protein